MYNHANGCIILNVAFGLIRGFKKWLYMGSSNSEFRICKHIRRSRIALIFCVLPGVTFWMFVTHYTLLLRGKGLCGAHHDSPTAGKMRRSSPEDLDSRNLEKKSGLEYH